mgnify:CR=1 FL=1
MSEEPRTVAAVFVAVVLLSVFIVGRLVGVDAGKAAAKEALYQEAVMAGHGAWITGPTGAPTFQWTPVKPEH